MPLNCLVTNHSRKNALASNRPPSTAVASGRQSHSTNVANVRPTPTPASVRYTSRVGRRLTFQSITASSTPPKMKASTAGSSGLSPRRQNVSANRTIVTALRACLCTKAGADMAATVRGIDGGEIINLGEEASPLRLYRASHSAHPDRRGSGRPKEKHQNDEPRREVQHRGR